MTSSVSADICIIVLNWNGWNDTLACLQSLARLDVAPASTVVVDNGSTDESVNQILSWAKEHFPRVTTIDVDKAVARTTSTSPPPFLLIRNPVNSGFAGGNNIGISWALQQNVFDFIWLLNNDTTVRPTALAALLDCAAQNQAAGIYGSSVVFAEDAEVLQCAGGCLYNPLTTIFIPCLEGKNLAAVQQDTAEPAPDYIFGASLFVRAEVFRRCGLLHDAYFLFYEEIDFCKRAERKGFTLHWCRESVVLHKGGSSVGRPVDGNKRKTAFANYHENLSTLLFTRRFYPWLLPFVLLFRFAGKTAVIGKRGDWYLFRPLCMAYMDFFTGKNRRNRYEC
jgi:GT2 family glycosyltransferase